MELLQTYEASRDLILGGLVLLSSVLLCLRFACHVVPDARKLRRFVPRQFFVDVNWA